MLRIHQPALGGNNNCLDANRGRFETCPYGSQGFEHPLRGRFAATRPPRFAKGTVLVYSSSPLSSSKAMTGSSG